jgi:hypothetical protein
MTFARLGSIALDCAEPAPLAAFWAELHLDLAVDDLEGAEAEALRLGATPVANQPAPGRWRVLVDPAGHPFCLSTQIPE